MDFFLLSCLAPLNSHVSSCRRAGIVIHTGVRSVSCSVGFPALLGPVGSPLRFRHRSRSGQGPQGRDSLCLSRVFSSDKQDTAKSPSLWGQREECGFGPLDTRTKGGRGRGQIQSPCGAGESPALLPLTPSCARAATPFHEAVTKSLPRFSQAQAACPPALIPTSIHAHVHAHTRSLTLLGVAGQGSPFSARPGDRGHGPQREFRMETPAH